MFSWICAQCGHDNPPSANECLSCGADFRTPPPSPAVSVPKVDAAPEEREEKPREEKAAVKTSSQMPTWLMTILAFFAIVGLGSGVYFVIQYVRTGKQAVSTGLDPAANLARTQLSNPLQKSVEVVGLRLIQQKGKRVEARFLVVNHAPTEIDNLSATVTLWASTSRSEEDSIGTFRFALPSIGPNESKELSAPLNTKVKFADLPDWQNATPEVQLTSP